MRLNNIYLLEYSRAVEIKPWHEEMDYDDPWLTADQADAIANRSGIRISRSKELLYLAYMHEKVVGAVWYSEYETNEYQNDNGENARVFDFDLAVDPAARGGAMVGLQLIDAALQYFRNSENDVILVYVVNPKLIRVLESKYNFEILSQSQNTAHMVYYK